MRRLQTGGQIDRKVAIGFSFDGKRYSGRKGDTLASALLANGVNLVGRSFKYHRPRGVFTAGSEEPNALVQIGQGAYQTPNIRATTQELYSGLVAQSQNRWPNLNIDILAINDFFAPFLGAGFYYKTFMWPQKFWERVYEPIIRRAAGLGRLSGEADPDIYDKAWAHCDLLIIGAGPAGLMAALTAARAGADVILADEDFKMGGRLNSERLEISSLAGADWAELVLSELASLPNVRLMPRTTVTGAYDHGTYGALERVAEHMGENTHGAPRLTFWRIVAKRAILAAGAIERPIAFPDNDRPGVMTAAAMRSYANRFGVATGNRIALFTNNNDGYRTARDLADQGIDVVAIIDPRETIPNDLPGQHFPKASVVGTQGRLGLRNVLIRTETGNKIGVEADCLAISGGWNPSVHLTCHMNARPVWNEAVAAFVPRDHSVPGLEAVGAAAGVFSTAGALKTGARAAEQALGDIGYLVKLEAQLPEAEDAPFEVKPFWHVEGKGRAWLDFQNDVTVKDVKLAYQENFRSVEHMKRYTTLGMATDQGKVANVNALAVMAELTGQSIPETGTTTYRPPFTPVPIGAMGARASGKGFQPVRLPPSHDWAVEMGAEFVEAGLWYRAAYFPQDGDNGWREACDREVGFVRNAVGICDVSTLGKIDVQGPDAGRFLDFIYSNTMSSLKPGRVRYGLILREDGFVMDDGTCARFSETHFVVTTTTAAAAQVMAHFDFVHQCLCPELDVHFVSVTDQWAQFAIAGPKSREVLNKILARQIDNETLPFMAHDKVHIGSIEARLFRISFSGEQAYELAVPARYGESLIRALVSHAKALGGGAYGMEALNVLRIEKGHVTHSEIHGRVTAYDIGFGKMVSEKKDSIGCELSRRAGLSGPEREQLVGFVPAGAVKRLLAGSRFIEDGAEATRDNNLGYMTSVCYSPTLGHMIGLGFVKNGRARIGETIRAIDLVRDFDTPVKIVELPFYDKEGGRLRD